MLIGFSFRLHKRMYISNMKDLHAELAKHQRKIAALEKEMSSANRKLLALPAKFGFKSMNDFIAELHAASGKSGKSAPKAPTATGRKKRAVITADTKAKVKSLANDGKTGAEIAKALNISLPSVQNIKKELGLVKARKAKK